MFNPFSRRALLALLGSSPLVAASTRAGGEERAGPTAPAPLPLGSSSAAVVARLSELAGIAGRPGERRDVDGGPGRGTWVWRDGDHSAAVAADPLRGLAMPHASRSPAQGAWLREWDGRRGLPEWFGAVAGRPDVDCRGAIQAALDLCPTVELGPGAYHVSGRLRILNNGTRLTGTGMTQTDQGPSTGGTQIVGMSSDATILQIGADSARQPEHLVECVRLADFTVRRGVDPATPAAGIEGPIGIALRWCVNCHIERVFSIDSARGWLCYGTVETYVKYCSAMRGRQGTGRANDSFVGFHLDYRAPLKANGGNASLYLDHCRSFGETERSRPTLAYSAGVRTDGGWVDLYINALEVGRIQYGIDGHGDRYDGGISYKTEDLIVTNCVLDPGEIACIRLQTADTSSAVQISNCYCATGNGGTAIELRDLGGSIALGGNQLIVGGTRARGIAATNVNNLRAAGNIHTRLTQPFRLENATSFHLADTIHGLEAGNMSPAIELVGCQRGKVDCVVNGQTGSYGTGVELTGAGNSLIEVACTNLQASAFPPGAPKLRSGGAAVRAAGPFGANCLAQGIMA